MMVYTFDKLNNKAQDFAIKQFVEDAKLIDPFCDNALRNPENEWDRDCIIECLSGCEFNVVGQLVV